MGQRSQIYVKVDNKLVIANYYQWNFAERMVSRARYGIEWIKEYNIYNPWEQDINIKRLSRVLDVNFDYKDVALSTDIIAEFTDYGEGFTLSEYVFAGQDCNDGKLFIWIDTANKSIKYAFTDYDITRPLTPDEYMKWEDRDSDELLSSRLTKSELATYRRNAKSIEKNATLMTAEELENFMVI